MYATSADWSFDQVADFSEMGPKMAASMKAAGAVLGILLLLAKLLPEA